MRKIVLNEVTGFKVRKPDEPILIRDSNMIMFYDTEILVPKVKYFNMPVGTYYIERGFFVPALAPREYKLARLPKPERNRRKPFDFKIEFGYNPNKCSIIWDEKRILFDNSFAEKPQYEVFFILYHEYGHALYESEHLADLYASNMMKVRGYNPLQICWAQMNSLSSAQYERKEFLNEQLIKTI